MRSNYSNCRKEAWNNSSFNYCCAGNTALYPVEAWIFSAFFPAITKITVHLLYLIFICRSNEIYFIEKTMINTRTINRKLHVHLCTQLYHFVLISSLIKFVSTGGNVISVVFLNRYFEIPEFLLFGKHVIFAACTERINYIIKCEDGNFVILNSRHIFCGIIINITKNEGK